MGIGEDLDRELLDEQIAYYRARASEYDRTSAIDGDPFAADAELVRAALRDFAPRGRILELAAGTGQWTTELAPHAEQLRAVDASSEMLERNAARVGDPRVEYAVADVFSLPEDPIWDVVFFGFFLSHVPVSRFASFWETVRAQLAPAGRVFFVDEGRHDGWREDWIDEEAGVVRRTLADGSVHHAVKVLWPPSELEHRLEELGWRARVAASGPFYWGTATPLVP
jgi:demethylmenaquinone methyltransferase/2-methoxy-6-polyprenyl-1,4-benzoquinol methylase